MLYFILNILVFVLCFFMLRLHNSIQTKKYEKLSPLSAFLLSLIPIGNIIVCVCILVECLYHYQQKTKHLEQFYNWFICEKKQ